MSIEQSVSESTVSSSPQGPQAGSEENFGNSGGYELDEDGQRVPHGMGQSKSSRRRRRKRKGKGPEGSEAAADSNTSDSGSDASQQVVGSMQAGAPAAQQAPRQARSFDRGGQQNSGSQQNNAQQNNGQGMAPGGTKRWKKKFRDRDRRPDGGAPQQQNGGGGFSQNNQQNAGQNFAASAAPQQNNNGGGFRGPDTHQPGNGGGGFKRKGGGGFGGGGGKQGRSRGGFVGPMDHSYRPANGNVFDPAGSTIQSFGNGGGNGGGRQRSYGGDSQPIDYSQGRAIPIAPGTPTKIYFFIEDLFFTAKIQETARKLGVKIAFVKNEKEQVAALMSGEDEDRPALIVFDLNNANAKPLTLIPKLKAKLKKSTSIVGFLSHLQGDLKAKGVEAGCDTVMPRAAFSQNLPNLLRRYGLEEAEEPNFNQ